MTFERINPAELGPPLGFSHAVASNRPHTIYLAGQTALNADGVIVGDTIVEQFERAMGNMMTALHEAGGTGEDLASVTIYITDVEAYRAQVREIGRVWKRLAGTEFPAMAAVGVARLWDIEALVEVTGVAVLE